MAEPEQETELLDATGSQSLSEDTCIGDGANEQADHDGMSEELLSQVLADANAFDGSSIAYSGEESETCATVQHHACGNQDLGVDNNGQGSHNSSNSHTILVHSSESILANTSEAIFSNVRHSLLTNGTSEVMGVDNNETFTVDVGSMPESHNMISVPSDIMPGSVIVSQPSDEHFQQSVVEVGDDTALLQDESHQMVHQMVTNYVQSTDPQSIQSDSQLIQNETFTQPHTITVSAASGMTLTPEVLQGVIQQIQAQQLAQQQAATQTKQSPAVGTAASHNTVSFTLVSPGQSSASSPPLGSSQNPIRIIQQGNRYTPMQQLTPEQLQQIMQVVQQQHVNKNTQENGGAVIFNPQTNTRIMYRVIYPSELHKTQNGAGHTTYQVVRPSTSSQEQQTGTPHQKRPYRKRKDIAVASGTTPEEEDKEKNAPDAPELSREEKEERKKHRPRTRSGRVSKPPKHMVQDYKHIHVLDWDEDYDDSDGGYSDFKHSDEEGKIKQEGDEEHSTSPEFFQVLGAGRPKNHKCQTCDKSYIGQAGLARHYRLNPDHCINPSDMGSISSLHNGSIDGDDSKDASLLPDGSSSRMSDSTADIVKTNCNTSSIENVSEDSNTQDSLNSTGATSPVVRRGRGRGGFRGRWAHLKHNGQIRRKNKLKELIKQCSDEDLMEVVLPRLVSSVSLWEYLMMKSEKGGSRPQVDVIYHEFEALSRHVKQACADYMQPLTWEELEDDSLQCKMIKVSDKNLAQCLNLEPVTYKVNVMPPGDSNSFSSLHNRLSSVGIIPSLDTSASSLTKHLSAAKANTDLLPDGNSMKRSSHSEDTEESAAKRVKTSSVTSSLCHVQSTSGSSLSPMTYSVTASLPQSVDSRVSCARSEPAVSTFSSVTSPQSTQLRGQLLAVTSSSSSSFQNSTLSSKCHSTSANTRSPFIHISCPTTKQQQASYTLTGPRKLSPAAHRTSKVQNQPVPVVISQPIGVPGSKTQILPFITNTSLAGQHHKVIVSASENQTLQTGTVPMIFAASSSQQINNPTLLFTSGSSTSGSRVVVRQPSPIAHGASHVLLTNQSSPSKTHNGGLSIHSFFPLDAVTTVQSPALPTNTRSLIGIMKPTEVRVSRQLFHETTCPSTASSVLTNGHSSTKTAETSLDVPPVLQHLHTLPSLDSSSSQTITVIGNGAACNNQQTSIKSINNKTLVTPPSGQQFAASPNKMAMGAQMAGVVDISVLAAMELSGDELGSLNTSSDSLNGSLSGSAHMADSIMAGMATTSSVSHNTDISPSLVDMVQAVHTDTFETTTTGSVCSSSHDIPLVNGSSSSFLRAKDDIISHSLSSPRSSTALTLSDTPGFINISSKPSKMISSLSQDSSSIVQSVTYMTTNGSLSNHGLKPDISSMNSSILMTDISSLPFTEQGTTHIVDGVSGHLSGISPILSSDELQENTISILSEPLSCSELQEADGQNAELGEGGISDSLIEEDEGQLLSDGTNIYQTEDGTFIIQKANGNTYQLQGAQGLSLETVQALLSGTLDQLVGGDAAAEGIQTDIQLH